MSERFIAGTDIGGTFTDCVLIEPETGRQYAGKAPTTPDDLSEGMLGAIRTALAGAGVSGQDGLGMIETLLHGTTVGTNAMVERKGAKTGAIVTKGHRDALSIMRVDGRVEGLAPGAVVRMQTTRKPEPLIPAPLIREVTERVDYLGSVLIPLHEDEVRDEVSYLLEQGVTSIALMYLWSFRNPAHEQRTAEMIRELSPEVAVSVSSALAPRTGEYERMAAAAVNAFVGPVVQRYLGRLEERVRSEGFNGELLIMQCAGGVVPLSEATAAPLITVDSGPAGGMSGAAALGRHMREPDLIATDMGGTSFDVGLVTGGVPVSTATSVIDQYRFYVPRLDVSSIGSGGGSIIAVDPGSGALTVGPESAGAVPGPACYGRGDRPTVTDADLLLGHLNPDYFLGGSIVLDRDAAEAALAPLAEQLGAEVVDVALGALRVVDAQMADLIRKETVESGYDPRRMTILAYGGAGPLHASGVARELGVAKVVVPLGDIASTFSAYGIGRSDLLHVHDSAVTLPSPFDHAQIAEAFESLERSSREQLLAEGIGADAIELLRSADMQYAAQINEIEVPLLAGEINEAWAAGVAGGFERRYEELYGEGTGYAGAGILMKAVRVRAFGRRNVPLVRLEPNSGAGGGGGERRRVYTDSGTWEEVAIARQDDLEHERPLSGPMVVELPDTTILLRVGDVAKLDEFGNLHVSIKQKEAEGEAR